MVRQASQEATDVDMLLSTLTRQIKTETEVSAFRQAAERVLREDLGLASAQVKEAISQVEIKAATDALVPLIGPVARVLVTRQAVTAVGRDDFYRRLADAIPNEQDRAGFLTIRGKLPDGGKH
jgi:serine/threonine-protein kinase